MARLPPLLGLLAALLVAAVAAEELAAAAAPATTEAVVAPIVEAVVAPMKEALVAPMVEAVVAPIVEAVVAPMKEAVVAPMVEAVVAPMKEALVAPMKEAVVAPAKEAVVAPMKETVVAPAKEAVVAPMVEAVVAPAKEAVVAPTKEAVVAPAKEAVGQAALPPTNEAATLAATASLPRILDSGPAKRYDGHLVLKVVPATTEQIDELRAFFKAHGEVDVWKRPRAVGEEVHFRVSPDDYSRVTAALDETNFKYEAITSDLQRIIDNQTVPLTRFGDAFDWNNYHRLSSLYGYMQSLAASFPQVATLVDGGLTYEGRHMLGLRVAYAPNLPVVFIEGGIHGREWIAPAVAAFLLKQLVTPSDPRWQHVARSFEWHVFPSVNPDAYEYSHTTDRLWRKSMKRYSNLCMGADLNRNFAYRWGTAGVSWSPCSETFPGSRAESEVETRYRIKYMEPLLPRMKAFIALHSYSQLLLFPWGDSAVKAANYDALFSVGDKAAQAYTRRYGTSLTMGNLATILYPVAGSSMDWVYSQGVPFAYTYELRPSQSADGLGFLLPANQILPTAEETADSVLAMMEAIMQALGRW